MNDTVNHPSHYTFGKFEVIDVLEDWFPADSLLWQVGKYISRAGRKGAMLEDLNKARWYLQRRIEQEEKKNELQVRTQSNDEIIDFVASEAVKALQKLQNEAAS
jgi:hypothetical protein